MTFELHTFNWSAVVAICSFLALIGVIATLIEMRRQRKYTYMPLLAVEQKQFVIKIMTMTFQRFGKTPTNIQKILFNCHSTSNCIISDLPLLMMLRSIGKWTCANSKTN